MFRPTRRSPSRHRGRGLTLIEMLVALVVLAVVIGVAAPSFTSLVVKNEVAATKSSFASALALARSEAARAGQSVIVKAASGGSSGNEFGAGWNVYLDTNGDGQAGDGDTLLRHYEALASGVRLHGNATLTFSASGYLSPAGQVTYTVCRTDGQSDGFSVIVGASGSTIVQPITSCSP